MRIKYQNIYLLKIGRKVLSLNRLDTNEIFSNMALSKEFVRDQLIQPIFVHENEENEDNIPGLGKNKILFKSNITENISKDIYSGCRNFIFFFVPKNKSDLTFKTSFQEKILSIIKKEFGNEIKIWVDLCLCSFTRTGHCCLFLNKNIDYKQSLRAMSDIALSYSRGGADGIAPSSMLKGIVNTVRKKLDHHNFKHLPIMSYSTKFASNFYGPFRAAADSSPSFGDRTSYQLDYTDKENAIEASIRFSEEGADLLMVKPGLLSLDLIEPISSKSKKPVGAYQVSGEYSSLVYLADNKLIDFDSGLLETWLSFKRAGAQYIISYGSRYAKKLGL